MSRPNTRVTMHEKSGDVDLSRKMRQLDSRYNFEAINPLSGTELENDSSEKRWYIHWIDGRDGGRATCPCSDHTIGGWIQAGYFGENVGLREVGDNE